VRLELTHPLLLDAFWGQMRHQNPRPEAVIVGHPEPMRILVTNDDGIDSVGLHILARRLREHGEVVVVAPDSEYSGASAAFGAIHLMRPDVRRVHLDGLDESWSVAGPPALCVMFARLGAFGAPFDVVVAGINPGANVGRSIYHSGTVGAALTARNGGVHGIAVSQHVDAGSIEGQAWDVMLENQLWDSAAEVAAAATAGLVKEPPATPILLNLNVPNLPVAEMKGWHYTTPAVLPIRALTSMSLEPKHGHEDTFTVVLEWGEPNEPPLDSDAGAVVNGYVSATYLGRIEPQNPAGNHSDSDAAPAVTGIEGVTGIESALSALLPSP
jgi:5'-nucleotidase